LRADSHFSRTTYFTDPRFAAPERLLGVMGLPINAAGEIEAENLTLACRNAVLNMMELLQERGFSRQQCCGRPAGFQRCGRLKLRGIGIAAGSDLRRGLTVFARRVANAVISETVMLF
jgi:hypothetical protein